jgi:two-component system nitrogen regulation response regulator GlnG
VPAGVLLAGQHPGAAERPEAGPAEGPRHHPAPGSLARPSGGAGRLGHGPPSAGDNANLEAFVRLCLASDDGDQYAQARHRLDRVLLPRVLEATGGNQQEAARRLGIARETLRRRLRELGIHLTRRLKAEEGDPS